jgi:hypothetical protein
MVQQNSLDNEIQVIPPNSDPTTAYIKLSYDWREETGVDKAQWQPHLLAFNRAESYKDVLNIIEKYVNAKLKKLAPDLRERLVKSNFQIVFQLTLQSADKLKQHACPLDASGTPRLRTLQDLYGNREKCRPVLSFMVERRFERKLDEDGSQRRVRIRTRHDCHPSSEYFLIGSIPITSDKKNSDPSSTVPKDLQYIKTVDRYFCKYSPALAHPAGIVSVRAWRPLECHICDVDSENEKEVDESIPEEFEPSDLSRDQLNKESCRFFGDLLKSLQEQVDETTKPHVFGPCQPQYRFCNASDMFRSVGGLFGSDEKPILIAVRFVQHLEPDKRKNPVWDDYQFPTNCDFASDYATVLEDVKKNKGAMALIDRHRARGGTCNVELWILPQGHNYLYKFKPDDEIYEFLAQDYVEEGDFRLYMEVHVVPTESILSDLPTDEVMRDVGDDQLHVQSTDDLEALSGLEESQDESQVLHFEQDEAPEQADVSERDEEDGSGEEDGSEEGEGRNADVNENDAENEPDGKDNGETQDEDDEVDDESDDEDDDDDDNDGEIRIRLIFDVKGLDELMVLHGQSHTVAISKRQRHQGFFLLLGNLSGSSGRK